MADVKDIILTQLKDTIQYSGCCSRPSCKGCSDKKAAVKKAADNLTKLNPSFARGKKKGYISFSDNKKHKRFVLATPRFLVRKLELNNYMQDDKIQQVSGKINNALFVNLKIVVIKGKKITEAYKNHVGTGSCMTGNYADLTLLYEMNPDIIQMVIARQNKDSARAILWKLDGGAFYMDRVYSNVQFLHNAMQEFAKKNKWYARYPNNIDKKLLKVTGLNFENGHVPYMDSFCYGSIVKGLLNLNSRDGKYCLNHTNGYIDGEDDEDMYHCRSCGENYNEDSGMIVNYIFFCEECFNERFIYCEMCSRIVEHDNVKQIERKMGRNVVSGSGGYTISCCGVCYKREAKVLADSLKKDKSAKKETNEKVVPNCVMLVGRPYPGLEHIWGNSNA